MYRSLPVTLFATKKERNQTASQSARIMFLMLSGWFYLVCGRCCGVRWWLFPVQGLAGGPLQHKGALCDIVFASSGGMWFA